jgi:hypothetical protein
LLMVGWWDVVCGHVQCTEGWCNRAVCLELWPGGTALAGHRDVPWRKATLNIRPCACCSNLHPQLGVRGPA